MKQSPNGTLVSAQDVEKVYDTGKIQARALRGVNLEVH